MASVSEQVGRAILDTSIGVLSRRAAALRALADKADPSKAVVLRGTAAVFEACAADISALDLAAIEREAHGREIPSTLPAPIEA